jgi:hypothetical protein
MFFLKTYTLSGLELSSSVSWADVMAICGESLFYPVDRWFFK